MVVAESAKLGVVPVAIGGLTMGADPVALAIGMGAARAGAELQVFSIRKQAKAHGLGERAETTGDELQGERGETFGVGGFFLCLHFFLKNRLLYRYLAI